MGARSFNRTVAERGFTRFLILRPSGANCPPALSEALREHWDAVVEVTNPLRALAELCVMTRAEQPRRNWGLPAQQRLALIIVKQSAFHDLAPLQRVLRDGLHEVSVWVDTGEMYLEISDPTHKPHPEQPDRGFPNHEYQPLRERPQPSRRERDLEQHTCQPWQHE